MRVTRATQEKTRTSLLAAARALFAEAGLEGTTTRAIAARAGVAAGTLFNYFPGKEALAAAVIARAVEEAETELDATRRAGEALEETLFARVAIQLRYLAPYRSWASEVLRTETSPLRADVGKEGSRLGLRQLERVERRLAESGDAGEQAITLHLYWSLYLGVLDFWSRDESRNQEATLALLDRSMGLFCRALRPETTRG